MCKASSSFLISASGMRFRKFFSKRRTRRACGREKVWKLTLLPSPRDRRAPIEARQPSAVSGTNIMTSPFICASNLLAVFARIHSRNFLAFLTPDTHTGVLLRRSRGGGGAVFRWGAIYSDAVEGDTQGPGHVTWYPGARAPRGCFHWGSGYWSSAGTLVCDLQRPIWLLRLGGVSVQVWASGVVLRDVLPPPGYLDTRGDPRDALSSLPPLPSCEFPVLVGSGAKESTPESTPLTGRLATSPAYAAPTSSYLICRPLDAPCSPVEAGVPFACAGRCADSAPGTGPGAWWLVPSNRPSRTCPTLWLYACPRWLEGAGWETEFLSPAEPGRRPLGWPVRRSPGFPPLLCQVVRL
jgi:hypothetical protein